MDLISLLRLHKYYLYYFSSTTSIFHHHLFLSIRRNFYQIIKDISRNSHNPIFQFLISNRVQTPLRPSWFKRFLSDDSPLDNFINIQNHRRSGDTLIIKGRMVIKAPYNESCATLKFREKSKTHQTSLPSFTTRLPPLFPIARPAQSVSSLLPLPLPSAKKPFPLFFLLPPLPFYRKRWYFIS